MEESREKAERLVDVNTIQHTNAREIGDYVAKDIAGIEVRSSAFLTNK